MATPMWKWLAILALSGTGADPQYGLSVGGAADSGTPFRVLSWIQLQCP